MQCRIHINPVPAVRLGGLALLANYFESADSQVGIAVYIGVVKFNIKA